MNISPRTKERLAQQHEKYLNSLPAKKQRILSCWQGIQVNGWNCSCLADLKMEVHRLAGSAGSYGFSLLGSVAQDLDRLLISPGGNISESSNIIADLVLNLMDAFDQAINT